VDAAEADTGQGTGPGATGAPVQEAGYADAEAAIRRGDLDAAAAAYRAVLDQRPGDTGATQGLGRVELLRRTRDLDEAAVRRQAADQPDDVAAQIQAADLDVLGGHVAEAFSRLVDAIRRASGDDRDRLRTHLLELFDVVGPEDPRVRKARSSLASALF
jgi:putative thioredoxin